MHVPIRSFKEVITHVGESEMLRNPDYLIGESNKSSIVYSPMSTIKYKRDTFISRNIGYKCYDRYNILILNKDKVIAENLSENVGYAVH